MKTITKLTRIPKEIILFLGLCILMASPIFAQPDLLLEENFETGIWPPRTWEVKTSASISEKPIRYSFPNFYENWFLNDLNVPSPWGRTYIFDGDASAAVGGTNLGLDPTFDWLITDTFSIGNTNTLNFNYWMYMLSDSFFPSKIFIMGKELNDSSWEILKQFTYAKEKNRYTSEVTFSISTPPNKTMQLAFVHNSTYQFAIDKIRIYSYTTGIAQELTNTATIKLYPNPSRDQISLNIPIEYIGSSYTIRDLTSQILLNGNLTNYETQLDISTLKSGVYFIALSDPAGRVWNKKFVKN